MSLEQVKEITDLVIWASIANGLIAIGMIIVALILAWHLRQHRREATARAEILRDLLFVIDAEGQLERTQQWMRENSVVISDLDNYWQKVAFSIYTDLAEVAERSRRLSEYQP